MPTPTEPGQYWWAPPTDWRMLDQIVQVSAARVMSDVDATSSSAGSLCAQSLVQPCMPLEEWVRGTWGERIPDSPTLEAMREMATLWPATSVDVRLTMGRGGPIAQAEQSVQTSFGRGACHFCGRHVYGGHIDHTLDCPWRRAQEATP